MLMVSSNEGQVPSEAIYMLLSVRKLLLILTPPLILLITLALVHLIQHHKNHQQQEAATRAGSAAAASRAEVLSGQPAAREGRVPSGGSIDSSSSSSSSKNRNSSSRSSSSRISSSSSSSSSSSERVVIPLDSRDLDYHDTINRHQQHQQHMHQIQRRRQERQEPKTMKPNAAAQNNFTTTTERISITNNSTRSSQEHQQVHQLENITTSEQVATIDIELDRANFVLYNRGSWNRVYFWISKLTKRAHISARQRTIIGKEPAGPQQREAARLKLMAFVFTIESVSLDNHQLQIELDPTKVDEAVVQSRSPNDSVKSNSGGGAASSSDKLMAVRLRSNLTELYICFDQIGKLEAKVNGNTLSCLFNELTVDHKYVKYQSMLNSSWFIGFDKTGNPISGQDQIKRDGSNISIKRERCYQFTKLKRLTTTDQLFPEVKDLDPIVASPERSAAASAIVNKLQGPRVLAYHQRQLINMTRYRNILRYQLGRSQQLWDLAMESFSNFSAIAVRA